MTIRSHYRGFTLIEMVITIVILSIVSVFTFYFFTNLTRTYRMMGEQRGAHQEAAYILDRISRELRDAKYVSTDVSSVTFQRSHGIATDSGNLYVRYRLSGTDLYRDSGASAGSYTMSKVIGKNVTTFAASPVGSPLPADSTVQITVSISKTNQVQTYITKICAKNYPGYFKLRGFGGDYEDIIQ